MRFGLQIGLLMVAAMLLGRHAHANPCPPGNPPTNCGPPAGAILDLNGTAIPHTYQQYSINFTATSATTSISFALRDDPNFLALDDVSLTTGAGPNLLLNPGFELGPSNASAPTDWIHLGLGSDAANFGVVTGLSNPGPHSGTLYYRDGALQGYDGISQSVATTANSVYTISFWLDETAAGDLTFSAISTNGNVTGAGGNGIDLLVYAGAVPTLATPEPASLALLGVGLAGMGLLARRQRSQPRPRAAR